MSSNFLEYYQKLRDNGTVDDRVYTWRYFYFYMFFVLFFLLIFLFLTRLQVIEGEELYKRSERNHLQIRNIYPNRGIIFDRNGEKLVENIPSNHMFIIVDDFICKKDNDCNEDSYWNLKKIRNLAEEIESILGEDYVNYAYDKDEKRGDFSKKIVADLNEYSYLKSLRVLNGLDNEQAISLKTELSDFIGIYIQEDYIRHYLYGEEMAHVMGYVSKADSNDLERLDYIDYNDIIGKSGLEKYYDKYLIGKKGEVAVEVDSHGNVVSSSSLNIEEVENGKSLYLTIDADLQKTGYESLKNGTEKYNAQAGALIVEEVDTGKILVMANYPTYNSNDFVGGISYEKYTELLDDPRKVFTPRSIAGQQPPGSIFKTVFLSSALDAGVIDRNTRYLSSDNYELAGGVKFYEYGHKSYGNINVIRAIAISSNIYPCATVRDWEFDEFVDYMEKYGIGKKTGIDLPQTEEATGRLPSPENKIWLAENGFDWLDNVWYEPADSCHSVIGQGITTVTPIQAVNWTSTIANGGTVYKPYLGDRLVSYKDKKELVKDLNMNRVREKEILSDQALNVVREGMKDAVDGSGSIYTLRGSKLDVAAKTGTAEYGLRQEDGSYKHTHAWVIGFFPYKDPKYAFVVFLEDGGKSVNASSLAREYLDKLKLDSDGNLVVR